MGIGNTTPSSAIIAAFSGISPEKLTGRGTGIDDEMLKNKIRVIKESLILHNLTDPKVAANDPIDVLAKVGGFKIGHKFMHERLELKPLLDIGFRLGEGTGAALAF